MTTDERSKLASLLQNALAQAASERAYFDRSDGGCGANALALGRAQAYEQVSTDIRRLFTLAPPSGR